MELIGVYPSRFSGVYFTGKGVFPFSIGLEYRYGYSVRCVHTVWKCTGNLGVALVRGRYPGTKVDTVDDLL